MHRRIYARARPAAEQTLGMRGERVICRRATGMQKKPTFETKGIGGRFRFVADDLRPSRYSPVGLLLHPRSASRKSEILSEETRFAEGLMLLIFDQRARGFSSRLLEPRAPPRSNMTVSVLSIGPYGSLKGSLGSVDGFRGRLFDRWLFVNHRWFSFLRSCEGSFFITVQSFSL